MGSSATVVAVLRSGAMLVALVAALDTQAAPVAINSIAGLQSIQSNLSGDYVLSADIDASGFPFAPIGPFTGTLDGAGHTIANLTIDGTGRELTGLFSTIGYAATVRNLNIANASVTVGPMAWPLRATGGILAGLCQSRTIDSVSASGVLTGRSAWYVGGLVGELSGAISNSRTSVSVSMASGPDGNYFGGMVGYANGDVSWSHSTGPVSAAAVGVGGLVGYYNAGTVSNSYSTSSVSGGFAGNVGGLVGGGLPVIRTSYATGAVSGGDWSHVGGLVGSVWVAPIWGGGGSVKSSYATGTVTAGSDSYVGGVVGWSESRIASSYHTGAVQGGARALAGGVVGKSDDSRPLYAGTVVDSYWNTDNAGTAYGNGSALIHDYWEAGTGLTTAQLTSGILPSGFDPSVWLAGAGSYPVLRWQSSIPPAVVGIFSRKTHGTVGTFDLPLTGTAANPTVEPRTGGANGNHSIVFTFDRPVTGATVTVTEGTAVAAAPTFSATSMIVPLTGAANAQYVTVKVSNVAQAGGGDVGSGAVRFGLLAGDVNQSRSVTLSDMVTAKKSLGLFASQSNFHRDVNLSGGLTVSDLLLINANLTTFLPAP